MRVLTIFRRGQGKLQDEARVRLVKAASALGKCGVLAGVKKGKVQAGEEISVD